MMASRASCQFPSPPQSHTNPKWRVIAAFSNSLGVLWTENIKFDGFQSEISDFKFSQRSVNWAVNLAQKSFLMCLTSFNFCNFLARELLALVLC